MKLQMLWYGLGIIFVLYSCQPIEPSTIGSEDLFLPEDLRVNLWAESPMFYNPTAMDVDEKGRIYVSEAVNYRSFKHDGQNPFHHDAGDRIVILEDSDGDGQADQSKVFVQDKDLQAPVGIAVIGNQVIVSSAPSMIVYTDHDGDDVADEKEVFLTGFGGYDHDHSLHSVVAGPDGQWYFNTGNAGPHIVKDKAGWTLRSGSIYNGGTPYNNSNTPGLVSDDGRIWTGGLALRISPDGKDLKVMAHNFRNAYELTVDSYGNMWQNDNDDQVTACRTSWLMEGGNAGYFSEDGSRNWRADQRPNQSIFSAHWHQDDPGVMPAGDNSGAGAPTGVALIESDELGEAYRGMFLSADAGRNLVFGYRPKAIGGGFSMSDKIEFVTSVDQSTAEYRWNNMDIDSTKWFRPSDVVIGTDGAVYVADWYDPIVGGHAMHDSLGYGRIYRISPKDKILKAPKLNFKTTKGQIQALLNPAINVRNKGFLALLQQGEEVIPEVESIIDHSDNPYHVGRAIWLMVQLGEKGKKKVEGLLNSEEDDIRLVAFRALRSINDNVLRYAGRLAGDKSPAVRREVALTLRDYSFAEIEGVIQKVIDGFDGEDPWSLTAIGIALDGKENEIYPYLTQQYGSDPLKWSNKMANLVYCLHPESAITHLKQRVVSDLIELEQRKRACTALAFIATPEAAAAMLEIAKEVGNLPIQSWAGYWLQHRSTNDWAGYYQLKKEEKPRSSHVGVWRKELLAGETAFDTKIDLIKTMASDKEGGQMLINLAAENLITGSLRDTTAQYIFSNPDQGVRVLASEYFVSKNGQHIYNIVQMMEMRGRKVEGGEIFRKRCQSCHKAGNEGGDIGPALTDLKKKMDRRTAFDAIIHPEADIVFGYEPWIIKLKNGESKFGFIQGEGEYLSIKDGAGNIFSIHSSEVESRTRGRSLMPSPQQLDLSEKDIVDVVSYLWNIP